MKADSSEPPSGPSNSARSRRYRSVRRSATRLVARLSGPNARVCTCMIAQE